MGIAATNRRSFEKTLGVLAYVTVHKGGNISQELENLSIDQKTGVITLPAFLSGSTKESMPTHFTLQIAHHKDDKLVIVAQRERGDRYHYMATTVEIDKFLVHNEPPCEVRLRHVPAGEQTVQGIGPIAVWLDTQMQTRHGSNRADIIRITEDGKLTLGRILILYVDGHFRLVSEKGWEGQIHLRKNPTTPYELRSEDERIHSAFYGNDDVKDIMSKFVFVPDFGFPSIEGWLQMLLLPKFRELVRSCTTLETWEESEHFWSKPEPKVAMTEGQGIVEWYVHGTGGAAMGYVRLHTPIEHKGRKIEKLQIKHHSIDGPTDAQGLKNLRGGDIVRVHRVVDMDVGKTQHAPLGFVGVIYTYREEGEEPADSEDEQAAA